MSYYDEERDEDYSERTVDDHACDDECRGANHCPGHVFCSHCDAEICGCEAIDGLCPDCDESRRVCEYCDDWVFVEDAINIKDKYFCSKSCRDKWEKEKENK